MRTSSEGRKVQAPTTTDSGSGDAWAAARDEAEATASTAAPDAIKRSECDRIIGPVGAARVVLVRAGRGRIGPTARRPQDLR